MADTKLFSLDNRNFLGLRICRNKNTVSTELDGETVILDVSSGVYSGLDLVGTFIWNMMEGTVLVSEIRDEVLKKYDVDEDQCVTDLILFLRNLAYNGLIEISNENVL